MTTLSSILPPVNVSTASGTLPAGNGGTGLTSPGTSGNVLTSTGSAWVSSALPASPVTYPQNIQSGNYTLVLSDAGKHIYSANTGAQTITIPTNASVAFPIGTVITIVNQGTASILLSGAGVSIFPEGSAVAVTSPVVPAGATGQLVKVDTNSWEAIVGVIQANLVNYVVVGGGSGGQGYNGGGGGGVVIGASNFDLGVLTVTVGAVGSSSNVGGNSILSGSATITARSSSGTRSNASIPGGLNGSYYDGSSFYNSFGGGGGAGGAGGNGSGGNGGGPGGIGLLSTITGAPVFYGAGGDGGYNNSDGSFLGGSAGSGSVVVISVPASEYSGIRTGNPVLTRTGNNIVLQFTSSGTYTAAAGGGIFYSADMLVIAGGGGGGGSTNGAGGGAGGYLPSTQTLFRGVTYSINVGGGGGSTGSGGAGTKGTNSSVPYFNLTAIGGGGGGNGTFSSIQGQPGGSSGGASNYFSGTITSFPAEQPTSASGGFGNTGGSATAYNAPGGGGGAGGVGGSGASGGVGGVGLASSITGTSVTRAVGGTRATGTGGTANTGNGCGGGNQFTSGGSGVVIISIPTAFYTGTTTGSPVVTTSGSNTILQFNSSGSYTA